MPNIALSVPTDYTVQQQAIDRQRKMAELLQQEGMQPVDTNVAPGVHVSWTQGLAKMLQAGLGAYQQKQLNDKQAELGKNYRDATANDLTKYSELLTGKPATEPTMAPSMARQPNPDGTLQQVEAMPGTPAVAPNPSAARAALLNSQNPGLQQAALAAMLKETEPYNLRAGETRYGPGGQVVARGAMENKISPSGVVYNPYDIKPGQTFADPNKPFSVGPDNTITSNAPYQQFELSKAHAGANRMMTNVNAYMPASEAAQKDFMDKSAKSWEALQTAPVALQNIDRAKDLVKKAGGLVGNFAETKLETLKFFNNNLGTNIAPEQVKSAEELRSRLFMQIMENLKKMDAQPSQQQQKVMQEGLGNLGTDPGAIPKVLDAFGDLVKGKVAIHNKTVKDAESRGVKFPYNPTIDLTLPNETSGSNSNIDALLKKYGG